MKALVIDINKCNGCYNSRMACYVFKEAGIVTLPEEVVLISIG